METTSLPITTHPCTRQGVEKVIEIYSKIQTLTQIITIDYCSKDAILSEIQFPFSLIMRKYKIYIFILADKTL